jgi:hypothetical protein
MSVESLVTDWGGFEKLVAQLHETGEVHVEHNVTLVGRSGAPRQIDVVIRHKQALYEHLILAECKYWNSAVERLHVDGLAATVRETGASRGVIFTTKGFQSGAITQAKENAIDLFVVRDLTAEEWGLPGRVVDIFLHIFQLSIGNVASEGATFVGVPPTEPLQFNLAFGIDGPASSTPTLKRDGITLGPPLEQYVLDAAHKSVSQSIGPVTFNGGTDCTVHILCPVNVNPSPAFKIPMATGLIIIPKLTFDVGVRIAQSRITVDRAERYMFALAIENCISGATSAAARLNGSATTTLAEIVKAEPDPNQGPILQNGSIMRVMLKPLFPFEEMSHLSPGPHIDIRPSKTPPATQSKAS